MEAAARVTAKGQVTIPKSVREALGLHQGASVTFRVEANRAILAASGDLLDMAGSVSVPADKRGTPWDDVRQATRRTRTEALECAPSSTPTS